MKRRRRREADGGEIKCFFAARTSLISSIQIEATEERGRIARLLLLCVICYTSAEEINKNKKCMLLETFRPDVPLERDGDRESRFGLLVTFCP